MFIWKSKTLQLPWLQHALPFQTTAQDQHHPAVLHQQGMNRFPHGRSFRVVSQRSCSQAVWLVYPACASAAGLSPAHSGAPPRPALLRLRSPRRVTAEGSKRQRRWFHKLGQIPFSDICSRNPGCLRFLGGIPGRRAAGWARLRGRPGGGCSPRGRRQQGPGLARVHITKWVRKGIVLILETLPSYKSTIWHFIMLVLRSYKNLKLAMLSFHHTAKCSTYFNCE